MIMNPDNNITLKTSENKKPTTMTNPLATSLLETYTPPTWLKNSISAEFVPKQKLNLSMKNTPIHPWNLKEIEQTDFKFFIKREDLNESILGGNKIKKLEFSLAKAIEENCNHVITTGTIVSNHCRTTAIVCAKLGLKCTMLQQTDEDDSEKIIDTGLKGNLLLSMMTDANCIMIPKKKSVSEVNDMLDEAREKIEMFNGDKTFMILRGGTQMNAIFSGIELFKELIPTLEKEEITDICVTSGSGGTGVSLALANRIWYENSENAQKRKIQVHGIRVWGDNSDGARILKTELHDLNLPYEQYKNIITYHDDYCKAGYGVSNPNVEKLALSAMKHTGVALCTTYTGKAAQGMVDMVNKCPEKFSGKRILFVHTGGIPGLWGDDSLCKAVQADTKNSNNKIQTFDQAFGRKSMETSGYNSDSGACFRNSIDMNSSYLEQNVVV